MKAKWESFNVIHRHLPSHELEREWTKRFTASQIVDLKVGVSPSIVGLRMSPKHSDQVGRAVAGEASRSPHQRIHRQSILSTHEVIGGRLSQAIPPLIHCNHSSIIKWVNNTLEALSIAKQLIPYSRTTTRLDLPTTDSLHQPKEHSHEARVTSSSSLIIFARSQPTKVTLPLSYRTNLLGTPTTARSALVQAQPPSPHHHDRHGQGRGICDVCEVSTELLPQLLKVLGILTYRKIERQGRQGHGGHHLDLGCIIYQVSVPGWPSRAE